MIPFAKFIFVFFTFLATSLFAQTTANLISADAPNVFEYFYSPEGQVSIHIYTENDVWVVQKNIIADDGLPDLIQKKVFTTKEKALNYAVYKFSISEANKSQHPLELKTDNDLGISETLKFGKFGQPEQIDKPAILWTADKNWTWAWEIEFAKWVREKLHVDFFKDLNIANDCQDAYLQARMIFAFENKLPIVFRTAGGSIPITQRTMRSNWLSLPANPDWKKNKRFLKALDYVADMTYTHSLSRDSYPVEISAQGLIEGTVYLTLNQTSGHTLLVKEVNLKNGTEDDMVKLPLYTLNSTVPKAVRPLSKSFFYTSQQPTISQYGITGFVRIRWPKSINSNELLPEKQMPYYSQEQYSPEFMKSKSGDQVIAENNFSIAVFKRLNPQFNPQARISEGLNELRNMLSERNNVIEQGYAICKKGCVEGSDDYENWSTPSRDKRIKELMADLQAYANSLGNTVYEQWNLALTQPILSINQVPYSLKIVKWVFDSNLFNSNPSVPPETRWSLSPIYMASLAYQLINPLFIQRENLIKQSINCRTLQCPFFSSNYINETTISIDSKLKVLKGLFDDYINRTDPSHADLFKNEMTRFTSVTKVHIDFYSILQKIPYFNFDPRATELNRWGNVDPQKNELVLDKDWYFTDQTSNNKAVFISTNDYTTLNFAVLDPTDIKHTLKISLKKGILATNQSVSEKILWFDAINNTFNFVDTVTDQSFTHKINQSYSENDSTTIALNWVNERQFAFKDAHGVYLYELNGSTIKELRYFEGYKSKGSNIIVKEKANPPSPGSTSSYNELDLSVIFLNDPSLTPWNSNWTQDIQHERITHYNIQLLSPQLAKITWHDYNGKHKNGVFLQNIKTKKISPLSPLLINHSDLTKKYFFATVNNNYHLHFVDDQLNIIKTIDLSSYRDRAPHIDLDMIQLNNELFKINSDTLNLELIATLEGAKFIQFIDDLAIISIFNEKEKPTSIYYLYDLKKNQILKSADYISLLQGHKKWFQPDIYFQKSKYFTFETQDRINVTHTITEDVNRINEVAVNTDVGCYSDLLNYAYIRQNKPWETGLVFDASEANPYLSRAVKPVFIKSLTTDAKLRPFKVSYGYDKTIIRFNYLK
jgi:hypothetical protein